MEPREKNINLISQVFPDIASEGRGRRKEGRKEKRGKGTGGEGAVGNSRKERKKK